MSVKRNVSGMMGVYLVAAKLSELGFVVSPTLRNAAGADLLVTDQKCKRAFTVQVKTNTSSPTFFLIGKKVLETVSRTHIYVLADVRGSSESELVANFYIVPSKVLGKLGHHEGNWPNIKFSALGKYLNAWSAFGPAE